MDLEEALARRVSCRRFSGWPVAESTVLELLEAGSRAPSPLNQQPWEFLLLRGGAVRARVAAVAEATRIAAHAATGKGWVARYDLRFLSEAPVLIAVLADPTKIGLGAFLGDRTAHLKAASACVQNILLAATARGLGSLWFTLYDAAELKRVLGVDPALDIVGLLPVGYPIEEASPTGRQRLEEKVRIVD